MPAYEVVVIDSPPMNLLASARSLAARSDGVVLVVRAGQSQKLADSRRRLRPSGRRSSSARCSTSRRSPIADTAGTTRERGQMIRLFNRYWALPAAVSLVIEGLLLLAAVRCAHPAPARAGAGNAAADHHRHARGGGLRRRRPALRSTPTASMTSASGCRARLLIIRLLRTFSILAVACWALYFVVPTLQTGRGIFALALVFGASFVLAWRVVLRWILRTRGVRRAGADRGRRLQGDRHRPRDPPPQAPGLPGGRLPRRRSGAPGGEPPQPPGDRHHQPGLRARPASTASPASWSPPSTTAAGSAWTPCWSARPTASACRRVRATTSSSRARS